MENSNFLVNSLFFVALSLLILVSLGILYLSASTWRDRRRQERDRKGSS